jgi:hypothetical protein
MFWRFVENHTCEGAITVWEKHWNQKWKSHYRTHLYPSSPCCFYTPRSLFTSTATKNLRNHVLCMSYIQSCRKGWVTTIKEKAERTMSWVFCPQRITGVSYEWVRATKTCLRQCIYPSSACSPSLLPISKIHTLFNCVKTSKTEILRVHVWKSVLSKRRWKMWTWVWRKPSSLLHFTNHTPRFTCCSITLQNQGQVCDPYMFSIARQIVKKVGSKIG